MNFIGLFRHIVIVFFNIQNRILVQPNFYQFVFQEIIGEI